MKVLSIREPWASLIVNGYKEYEFRTWKTNYRGKFLIHASARVEKDNLKRFENYDINIMPGYIIGEADITDCVFSDDKFHQELLKLDEEVYKESVNAYGFKLENVKKYDKPIPAKGRLGFWEFHQE